MRCPFCGHTEDRVVDSRIAQEGRAIRRRRECDRCGQRFTTYETVETLSLSVIKRNQAREPYDRSKLRKGLEIALKKRPISIKALDQLVLEIENEIMDMGKEEIPAQKIGEIVMSRLKEVDKVAYVRFASVYREFEDISEFADELEQLKKEQGSGG